MLVANKGLGSAAVGGAEDLKIYVGYQMTAPALGSLQLSGAGIWGIRCAQYTRQIVNVNDILSGLSPGTYTVGMVGSSSDYADWNSNDYGYISVIIFN